MSMPQIGYVGLGWAVIAASTITENIGVAVGVVSILVLLSTLLIRFTKSVEKVARSVIREMQASGDLPTRLEREETAKALATLVEYNERNR